MAVASDSVKKEGKMKSPMKKKEVSTPVKSENGVVSASPVKRNNNPGVRLVGARIYDSVNGKTCHQCRQKTRDYMAGCKNMRNNKPCPIHFCQKCLLNRYGEKAEEVSLLEDWSCPRCRGICNCSFCMKRRGCQPTGQLFHTAKATGYSSVSDMLQTNGIDNSDHIKVLKDSVSQKKIKTSNNEEGIVSAENRGKENCIEGVIDLNANSSHLSNNPSDKQSVGRKRKEVNEKHANIPPGKEKSKRSRKEESTKVNGKISSPNKRKLENNDVNDIDLQNVSSFKDGPHGGEKIPKKVIPKSKTDSKIDAVMAVDETLSEKSQDPRKKDKKRSFKEGSVKGNTTVENIDPFALTPLPQGTGLTAVGGIDLQSEDVGNALQFLEFCAVFGKILDIKKGQPEAVLRDIMQGRSSRRGKCSLTILFLTNLLSFLKDEDEERFSETEGKNSWYADLKTCISECPSISRTMGLDSLGDRADGFENLNPSKKLKIINFICDEVLETVKIRDWIDDQNSKFAEKAKEAKEKVTAAKDEEKRLKQKMQDKIAQAIIAKNNAPLSISEHEAIVSQIKREAAEAHAAVMESKGTYSKYNQRSEAVRTEPFFLGTDGLAYWRLKCYYDKSVLLCQDLGTGGTFASDEKWSTFDVEQKEIIEKRINVLRSCFVNCSVKRVRAHKVPVILPSQTIEAAH